MALDTDEPNEALRQIASYLRTVDMTRDRAVIQDGETEGFWQRTEWLEGLKEIADECDRIRAHHGKADVDEQSDE